MTDQTDATGRAPADYAESIALPAVTSAVPVIVSGTDWWAARPAGSRLVGLVVARVGEFESSEQGLDEHHERSVRALEQADERVATLRRRQAVRPTAPSSSPRPLTTTPRSPSGRRRGSR